MRAEKAEEREKKWEGDLRVFLSDNEVLSRSKLTDLQRKVQAPRVGGFTSPAKAGDVPYMGGLL